MAELYLIPITFSSLSLQGKDVSSKLNWKEWKMIENITRWVCQLQILTLQINHHVPMVLLWHVNVWLLCSHFLICNHATLPLQIWQPLFPNKSIQVIICLKVLMFLSYVWYNLYCLLPWHPKVWRVSSNNYISNILYLPFQYQHQIYLREWILLCDWLSDNNFQKLATVVWVTVSLPSSKYPSSNTTSTIGFIGISINFFSLGQFSSFHQKILFFFACGYSSPW